jgi:single-stranded-DNA-specific exonuclease
MVLARRGLPAELLDAPLSALSAARELPGASAALDRLGRACRDGERVLVHGDYDVDGITSTVIMLLALRACGAEATYHIPHRVREGYGLGVGGVGAAAEYGAGLVVTVDCGTNAVEEAQSLADAGIDLIVTDHHRPDGETAGAVALVNPKLAETASQRPWGGLAGAGVAYVLASTLLAGRDVGRLEDRLLGLAGLGTVCDMVPLSGDSRILARQGLEALRRDPLPGLRALAAAGGCSADGLSERELAFVLGPRLNSCGRLGRADDAVELLLEEDPGKAAARASEIELLNRRRRKMGSDIWSQVRRMRTRLGGRRSLVLGDDGWHRGVVGIACSRAARRWGLPSVLVALDGDIGYGSARSVPGVSIHDLLSSASDLLEGYGGHHMAAGLRVRRENLGPLSERLEELLAGIPDDMFGPVVYVDGRLREGEVSMETLAALDRLRPFGEGNAEPVWISRRVHLESPRLVGSDRSHLSCTVALGRERHRAIGFGMADAIGLAGGPVDVAFRLREDDYRGGGVVQLVLEGVRRAAGRG